jgi:hypothetical protein
MLTKTYITQLDTTSDLPGGTRLSFLSFQSLTRIILLGP